MTKSREWGEGKRVLWTLLALIIMGIASQLLAGGVYTAIVFLVYGIGPTWSGPPPELAMHPHLIYILVALAVISVTGALAMWHRLFLASGYVSLKTQRAFDEGKWPVIGGYWKPLGYAIYLSTFGYLAWRSYLEEELWLAVLMGAIVLLYFYLAQVDFRSFLVKRNKGPDQLKE